MRLIPKPHFYLHLSISDRFVSSKIYDERDDFDFGIVKGVGVSKWTYFCIQPSSIFYLMCNPMCLLYRVIQDFVQKVLFFRYRQLEVGKVTGSDINTV